eukprot:c15872_g1_i3.p1 GENE.c15872_g1_i3~~c15872_g1_i3.p1  ORF type:complete len:203 (-),score=36.05 c15872_g1_i3:697-1305(-)
MLSALRHCHSRKIAHRDVKTQNVFLTRGGHVRLGDFGLARKLGGQKAGVSKTGTDCYMSPEMFVGLSTESVDGRKSDVWSVGVCVWELASLNFVFERDNPLLGACAVANPTIIEELLSEISRERYSLDLIALVGDMLRINPEHRPSTTEILHSRIMSEFAKTQLKHSTTPRAPKPKQTPRHGRDGRHTEKIEQTDKARAKIE